MKLEEGSEAFHVLLAEQWEFQYPNAIRHLKQLLPWQQTCSVCTLKRLQVTIGSQATCDGKRRGEPVHRGFAVPSPLNFNKLDLPAPKRHPWVQGSPNAVLVAADPDPRGAARPAGRVSLPSSRPLGLLRRPGDRTPAGRDRGPNVGDFLPGGRPRAESASGRIAKGGRAADVFLPSCPIEEARSVLGTTSFGRRERVNALAPLLQPRAPADLEAPGSRLSSTLGKSSLALGGSTLPRAETHRRERCLPRVARSYSLAQRFARHASPLTTTVYTHPSDEELHARVLHIPC